MAAALGADLVLDVARRRTGLDQRLDRARDVERRRTEAGVDVHQQRQVAHVGDPAGVDQHVLERIDAQVRQAQRTGGHAATGQVDRAIAGALRQQGVVGVDRADHLQWRLGDQGGAELPSWRSGCTGGSGIGHRFVPSARGSARNDANVAPCHPLINLDRFNQ